MEGMRRGECNMQGLMNTDPHLHMERVSFSKERKDTKTFLSLVNIICLDTCF